MDTATAMLELAALRDFILKSDPLTDRQSKLVESIQAVFSLEKEVAEAADEIERLRSENNWMKSQLQSHSIQMNGKHSWRWRGGWPLTSVRASNRNDAVTEAVRLSAEAAMKERTETEDE